LANSQATISFFDMAANWSVPREWRGERCFIIAGGESVKAQEHLIPKLFGPIIAIKQSVALRPDADVMFIAGKDDGRVCASFFPLHRGTYLVARGEYRDVPSRTKVLGRSIPADRLSEEPTALAGFDAGTSAINLAFLFGASEIVLLGYDMTGGRWLNDRYKHHLPYPPQRHFDLHLAALPPFAEDLKAAGVRVVNCSPISAVEVFEKRSLEEFV
jgi:hypothetical protein